MVNDMSGKGASSGERCRSNPLADLGPLYHGYSFFGVENQQLEGIYQPNQQAKAPIITAYIAYAIARSRGNEPSSVSFAELFCADGYYAMVARNLGCKPCVGIDNNRDNQSNVAPLIAERLGLDQVSFLRADIRPDSKFDSYDIVANVGGLYHTETPEEILLMSYQMTRRFLIVQNVVSLAMISESYFESPAPGWSWGSRYSRQSFDALIQRHFRGQIVYSHFNELSGNPRLEDRGSVYYLIEK